MIDKYSNLKTVYQLQQNMVQQNMHNAMSPISAISGYLELINLLLFQDMDINKTRIENYRKKIQNGVVELNYILEQLQDVYSEDYAENLHEMESCVEVNWLVRDICNTREFSTCDITAVCSTNPLHVQTDLFKCKLILSNLINYAEKSCQQGIIKVETNQINDQVTIAVQFQTAEQKIEKVRELLRKTASVKPQDISNSFCRGLITSAQLAEQLDGEINIKDGMQGHAALYLALPLLKQQ